MGMRNSVTPTKEKMWFTILGFLILGAIQGVSTFLVWVTDLPFPPALVGLLLFFLLLYTKIIPEKWIQTACEFLLNHIIIFFIPIIVGIIAYKELLLENWVLLTIMVVVPTVLTMVGAAALTEWMLIRKTRKKENRP